MSECVRRWYEYNSIKDLLKNNVQGWIRPVRDNERNDNTIERTLNVDNDDDTTQMLKDTHFSA